jgi:hypothetical protein
MPMPRDAASVWRGAIGFLSFDNWTPSPAPGLQRDGTLQWLYEVLLFLAIEPDTMTTLAKICVSSDGRVRCESAALRNDQTMEGDKGRGPILSALSLPGHAKQRRRSEGDYNDAGLVRNVV